MWLAIPRRRIFGYPGMFKDCLKLFILNRTKEGDCVAEFENEFAQYIGTKYAIAVSSGRIGLALILKGLGLKNHDEVILPAYTDLSVPSVIMKLGLKPLFVDIDPETQNIDAKRIEQKLTKNTKVLIATHLFGRPCALERILEIVQEHNLIMIEDCAHSIGTECSAQIPDTRPVLSGVEGYQIPDKKWKRVGGFGKAAFFSFSATKILNTFGGGMITTNSQELAERIRKEINQYSYPGKFAILKRVIFTFILYLLTLPAIFTFTGFPIILLLSSLNYDILNLYNKTIKKPIKSEYKNFKFANLQAFVGSRQLKNIDLINRRHIANAHLLKDLLTTQFISPHLYPLPQGERDRERGHPTYYFFVIESKRRKILARILLKEGIDTGEEIMRNCAKILGDKERFPITEQAIKNSLQIPIHFPLDKRRIKYIAKALNQYA